MFLIYFFFNLVKMRKYTRKVNSRKKRYGDYTKKDLEDALAAVKDGMHFQVAEDQYRVAKSTLQEKVGK